MNNRRIMPVGAEMEIPSGKFRGALPEWIIINGVHWEAIKTGIVKRRTYDRIENQNTGQKKTYERQVLLDFLKKNQKINKKNIVNMDNNSKFEQSKGVKQTSLIFPIVNF